MTWHSLGATTGQIVVSDEILNGIVMLLGLPGADWAVLDMGGSELPFVLAAVALAILAGRMKVSGIHRFITNRLGWLRDITQRPDAR